MKICCASALALFASVSACSEQPTANREETAVPAERSRAAPADAVYSADGTVTAVNGATVTISHGPVPGLGWPAMTMTFRASGPNMLTGMAPGDQVSFAFRRAGDGYVLTSFTKN